MPFIKTPQKAFVKEIMTDTFQAELSLKKTTPKDKPLMWSYICVFSVDAHFK